MLGPCFCIAGGLAWAAIKSKEFVMGSVGGYYDPNDCCPLVLCWWIVKKEKEHEQQRISAWFNSGAKAWCIPWLDKNWNSSNCAPIIPIVGAYVQTRKVESAQCNVGNDLVLKWNTSAPALCWTGKRKVESAVFNENFYSISYKKRIFTADKSPKKVTANLSDSKALNSAVSCNQLILLSTMSLYLQAKHIHYILLSPFIITWKCS